MQAEQPLSVKRSSIVYEHMRDPALLRYYYKMNTLSKISKLEIDGSSPTDLFIGRYGYPNVYIGPLIPPSSGDTSILAEPERWTGMSIDQITDMRSQLVRGMKVTRVGNVEQGKVEEMVRDLALAGNPTHAEMEFVSKPFVKMEFRDEVQPFGISAKIKTTSMANATADTKIERSYRDIAATAKTSLVELYNRGVRVSKIQRAFSAGLFGIKNQRRFVPTRWSITAVDDTLSKVNLEEVKQSEPVDAVYAYYNTALDNRWLILFMPGNWQYESIEAWYPKTVWNQGGTDISIYSSYEPYGGRKTYAEIGGCYYAARLAVTEKLKAIDKQAVVLILREVHDGYIMPVGVWNVREHVRQTLDTEPVVINGTNEVMNLITKKLDIPVKAWINNSRVLKDLLQQKKMSSYLS